MCVCVACVDKTVVYEFYDLQPLYESLGLPHLNQSDYPNCGVVGLPGSKSCTEQDILTSLLSTHPVAPVNSRPVYSQLSFLIISLALERATGKNYSQLLHETVIQPLQLTNTGVSPGDSDRAIIPPGMSNWGSDVGLNAPYVCPYYMLYIYIIYKTKWLAQRRRLILHNQRPNPLHQRHPNTNTNHPPHPRRSAQMALPILHLFLLPNHSRRTTMGDPPHDEPRPGIPAHHRHLRQIRRGCGLSCPDVDCGSV